MERDKYLITAVALYPASAVYILVSTLLSLPRKFSHIVQRAVSGAIEDPVHSELPASSMNLGTRQVHRSFTFLRPASPSTCHPN